MADESLVYTVDQLTEEVKQVIRRSFDRVQVEGEISEFTHYKSSGHMYFSLTGDNSRLQSVMFKRANNSLGFQPEEGMQVVATGRVNVYEERGEYQLIVDSLEESGLGPLEKEFQELKETLESEGALEPDRKQPLPSFPSRIGVVTSGDGAAFWDIARTIRNRCPLVQLVLYPSKVNGRDSGTDIAHAVKRICDIETLDCLIVGRGGGSPEDLWGFNTEPVARAILNCPVPVISAVGHEVDVSISDLVADHRSPTPTGAGKDVVPSMDELIDQLNSSKQRFQSGYRNQLDRRQDKVRFIAEKPVFSDPSGWVEPFHERFQRVSKTLHTQFQFLVTRLQNRLETLNEQIQALGPDNVLDRGYTMVQKDGEVVTSVDELDVSDSVSVQWSDGQADVEVLSTRSNRSRAD